MATLNVPVERISQRTANFDVLRFVLIVLAAPFMAVGFTARFVVMAFVWAWFAVVEGWDYAAKMPAGRGSG